MAGDGTGGNAFYFAQSMTKTELRSRMRAHRRALSATDQQRHGESFCRHFIRTPAYQQCRALACYSPVSGELDPRPLMTHALRTGRAVYLPVIEGESMWFARWYGSPLPIDRASGLPQPSKRTPRLLSVRSLDLVIVPLVAFARDGRRLGQGGGYYDRMFAYQRRQAWKRPRLIGAAHDFQEHNDTPADPWDVPLAGVVTNAEAILNLG